MVLSRAAAAAPSSRPDGIRGNNCYDGAPPEAGRARSRLAAAARAGGGARSIGNSTSRALAALVRLGLDPRFAPDNEGRGCDTARYGVPVLSLEMQLEECTREMYSLPIHN